MIETGLDANHKSSSRPGFFRSEILIRFAHCDPAGIVFYPRYLEMFNNLVEDWFREGLGLPFPDLIKRGWGVPTAHLEVDFVATCFLGRRSTPCYPSPGSAQVLSRCKSCFAGLAGKHACVAK